MISASLANCTHCNSIAQLISEIDCKIFSMAKQVYNNVSFALNIPVRADVMWDLLNYRRILTRKLHNPDYASAYSVDVIAGRIKTLKI